jgi:hypothetical protein
VSVTTTSSLTHRIVSKIIQGLHPAIPETAEPLCANVATAAVIIPPITAAILLVGRIVIRRPLLSLPTKSAYFVTRAGLASVAVAPAAAYLSHYQSQIPTSILQYEGITPPRYQIWQSSKEFTYDDAILIGGIGGMLLSFRLKGLRSLFIGNRLLGRLGACSTGMSSALFIEDISSIRREADLEKPSIQRYIYERAVALRKLNDNPKFNQSLASGPQLAERIWKMTVKEEKKALSLGFLTDEEKAVLRPTMVFSWLDAFSYELGKSLGKPLPVNWKYPENASPAEKRDYVLKELQSVARVLKPYAHNVSCVTQGKPIPRHGTFAPEHSLLLILLFSLLQGLGTEEEEGKPRAKVCIHDCLSVIDADKDKDHVPVESFECLRRLKKAFQKKTQPGFVAGADNLIREFERRATKNKDAEEIQYTAGV